MSVETGKVCCNYRYWAKSTGKGRYGMTREEAINELKEDIELYMPSDPILLDRELPDGRLITALEMAIEALEQEPCEDATLKDIFCMGCEYKEQELCEDCISRQAVIDILDDMIKDYAKSNDFEKVNGVAWVKVQKLPPINPQKIGHWIADVDRWGDIVTTVNGYRCDKCNTFNADKDNYCPNCGCHMIEPQESEE